ncbi:hypothetical protein DFJ73DRAFT_759274 [Zopfochytrium polystomum]|nr:hypothetical protein DFJ73DRAFT_759274 [Zopfochytrium polystomum]
MAWHINAISRSFLITPAGSSTANGAPAAAKPVAAGCSMGCADEPSGVRPGLAGGKLDGGGASGRDPERGTNNLFNTARNSSDLVTTVQPPTIASAVDVLAVSSSPAAQASGDSSTAVVLVAAAEDAPATLTAETTSDALNVTDGLLPSSVATEVEDRAKKANLSQHEHQQSGKSCFSKKEHRNGHHRSHLSTNGGRRKLWSNRRNATPAAVGSITKCTSIAEGRRFGAVHPLSISYACLTKQHTFWLSLFPTAKGRPRHGQNSSKEAEVGGKWDEVCKSKRAGAKGSLKKKKKKKIWRSDSIRKQRKGEGSIAVTTK